jgi:hypothetical protein
MINLNHSKSHNSRPIMIPVVWAVLEKDNNIILAQRSLYIKKFCVTCYKLLY